jgi:hypothetical protein
LLKLLNVLQLKTAGGKKLQSPKGASFPFGNGSSPAFNVFAAFLLIMLFWSHSLCCFSRELHRLFSLNF